MSTPEPHPEPRDPERRRLRVLDAVEMLSMVLNAVLAVMGRRKDDRS